MRPPRIIPGTINGKPRHNNQLHQTSYGQQLNPDVSTKHKGVVSVAKNLRAKEELDFLISTSVWKRALRVFIVFVIILAVVYGLSITLVQVGRLSPGFLRGKFIWASQFSEREPFWNIFVKTVLFNFIGGTVVVGTNLLQVRRLPLGYVSVWIAALMFALTWGTDSFLRVNVAPPKGIAAFVGHVGWILETTFYSLTAAATVRVVRFRYPSLGSMFFGTRDQQKEQGVIKAVLGAMLFEKSAQKIGTKIDRRFNRSEKLALLVGLIALILAA